MTVIDEIPVRNAKSNSIGEVKQHRVRSVAGWVALGQIQYFVDFSSVIFLK